jgi:hypothetical protein
LTAGKNPRSVWTKNGGDDFIRTRNIAAQPLARPRVPDLSGEVKANSQQLLTIGAELNRFDRALVGQGKGLLAVDRFPDSSRPIRAGSGEPKSIRAECNGQESIRMDSRLSNGPTGGGIPQASASVITAGQQHVPV